MAPAVESLFSAQPTPIGAGGVIVSPFQFVTTGEENLRIESIGSAAGVTVAVSYRYWTPAGGIQANTQTHTPNSDRTVARSDFALGAGALLNLAVYASAGAPAIGQCFVRVQIIRGLSGATIVLGTLLQGAVTASQGLGWPGSPIQNTLEVEPYTRFVAGTRPAAGSDWIEQVPTNARWELLAIRCNLVTVAGGADRRTTLSVWTGVVSPLYVTAPAGVPPSSNTIVGWAAGLGVSIDYSPNYQLTSLPTPLVLLAGQYIAASTDNLNISDRWGTPQYVVREWLEGA